MLEDENIGCFEDSVDLKSIILINMKRLCKILLLFLLK